MNATHHILFTAPVPRSQVTVCARAKYGRKEASRGLEEAAGAVWEARLQDNPRLFNGMKFRYHSVELCNSKKRDNVIVCNLGIGQSITLNTGFSCYKDYTTTNMSRFAAQFAEYGRERYGDSQSCQADIIGHSAILVTADGYVVMQLRSQHVGEYCGTWHFPGGHPEPEEIGIKSAREMEKASERKIVDELFDSLLREMKEELNVSTEDLGDPRLISIIKCKDSFYKPEFNFLIRTQLTALQISEKYNSDNFDDYESDEIGFWWWEDLRQTGDMTLLKFKEEEPFTERIERGLLSPSVVEFTRCLSDGFDPLSA